MRAPKRRRRSAGLATSLGLAASLGLLLAGCIAQPDAATAPLPAGEGEPAAGRAEAGPTSPSAAAEVDRTNLIAVYRAWWTAVQDAFARGDPEYLALASYGVDPILTNERNQIRALHEQGIVQRTHLSLTPHVLHQGDTVAEIADCLRGPAGTYRDTTEAGAKAGC